MWNTQRRLVWSRVQLQLAGKSVKREDLELNVITEAAWTVDIGIFLSLQIVHNRVLNMGSTGPRKNYDN